MTAFPELSELVPHAAPMLLLDRVLAHDDASTSCSASLAASQLFAESDGSVPSFVGLEYMAQCAAVHGGLASRARGQSPRPGLLLGSRRLRLHTQCFEAGKALRVEARHHRGELGLVSFDCSVRCERDEVLVEGRVNLYILQGWDEFGELQLG